jgi:Predicted glycosyltransferases
VIENKENLLFAKANNQAAAVAQGEYLLLLNSDTLIEKGNIEKLINFLDRSDTRIACAGPVVVNKDKTHQSSGYALPSICERFTMVFKSNRWLPRAIARLILPEGTPGLYTSSHKVGWIAGCCILIRKSIYQLVGGLNEMLEFYGEEPELGWKFKTRGYETWVVSDSSIIHLGGCSTKTDSAHFLNDLDGKLYRYSQLQKYTVGYLKAIRMSQIVIIAAHIKQLLARDRETKKYFKNAIEYEKKVVDYLRNALRNEIND